MKKIMRKATEVSTGIPTPSQLTEILSKLQELLKIQDWSVELRLRNDAEMFYVTRSENMLGYCVRTRTNKSAIVYLNTERQAEDWYFTLLHELYHVVTDEYTSVLDFMEHDYISEEYREGVHTNNALAYERLVNQLAYTFCSIYPYSKLKEEL